MSSLLRADVYVSSRLPVAVKRQGEPSFSPISCTLIHGDAEAVLVDTPISISQTEDLVRWIKETAPNKQLVYIYITHGHGDHFFGIPILKKHWPDVRVVATLSTVAHMKQQLEPAVLEQVWLKMFPGGQIAQPVEIAEPLDSSNTFHVEEHEFRAVPVGHSDTYDSTVLYVSDIGLVAAGDVVYGDVHQFFGEANTPEKRKEWLQALEIIESLRPHTVVAGHKRAGTVDGVFNVRATREYLLAFEDCVTSSTHWEETYEKMKLLYPSRINTTALLRGAVAAFETRNSKLA